MPGKHILSKVMNTRAERDYEQDYIIHIGFQKLKSLGRTRI